MDFGWYAFGEASFAEVVTADSGAERLDRFEDFIAGSNPGELVMHAGVTAWRRD